MPGLKLIDLGKAGVDVMGHEHGEHYRSPDAGVRRARSGLSDGRVDPNILSTRDCSDNEAKTRRGERR